MYNNNLCMETKEQTIIYHILQNKIYDNVVMKKNKKWQTLKINWPA